MFTEELLDADFKTSNYDHQMVEFEISCGLKARAILWSMRSGKSKLLIDTACHLFIAGEIDAVIIIAPNGIHHNWIRRELPVHHWDSVERDTLVWQTHIAGTKGVNKVRAADRKGWHEQHNAFWARAERLMSSKKLCWFSFAAETLIRKDVRKLLAKIVKKRRCLIIFDESDDFRTPGSTRTKMVRALIKRCPYRRISTGSVITNSPLAAFSQYELLEPGALGFKNYGLFKKEYAEYVLQQNRNGRQYPVLDKYKNLDDLRDRMSKWSSVVRRKDIKDMPDLVRRVREIELSSEQARVYDELHKQFTIELNDEYVSIGENTSRITKLQQVVSGYLIDEFKDVHLIPGENPRLEALADEVYLASGKIIIWCRFQRDIDIVSKRLMADGYKFVEYHGRVSSDDKLKALDALRDDPDVDGLIGQPQAGGRGVSMAAADHVFNYSHTFDAIIREQSEERASEIKGRNVDLCDFVAPGVDEYILENVRAKFDIAEDVARTGMYDILRRLKI